MVSWSRPSIVPKIKGFLRLVGYYHMFVHGFSQLVAPLTNLLKKGMAFDWTNRCEKCFREVKEGLTSALILTLPKVKKFYVVLIHASSEGYEGILMQNGNVIAYTSRQLHFYEKNYATHDLKLGVVVYAFKICYHYLCEVQFEVYTDYKSLTYLFSQKDLNLRQRRWVELLVYYDF